MTAPATLATALLAGLSEEGRAEMETVLHQLSATGSGELVALLNRLVAGEDLLSAMSLPPQTVDLLYAQAHARLSAGQDFDAVRLFQTLVALAPDRKDHWLGLGVGLRALSALAGAHVAFEMAEAIDPECPAVALHQAELASLMGQTDRALRQIARFDALPTTAVKNRAATDIQRLRVVIGADGHG